MAKKRITILGATGFTGRLIARELRELDPGVGLAGRDPASLEALRAELGLSGPLHVADVFAPASLEALFASTDLLVQCVGPYSLFGEELLARMPRKDFAYLDLSGEQSFVAAAGKILAGSAATAVSSLSFESALTDLLALRLCRKGARYSQLHSFYHFDKTRPSPGTRATMKLARSLDSRIWRRGEFHPMAPFGCETSVALPHLPGMSTGLFMPYPEINFLAERFQPAEAASFLALPPEEARMMKMAPAQAAPLAEKIAEARSGAKNQKKVSGPGHEERAAQEFSLTLVAREEGGAACFAGLAGRDMYRLTAKLVAGGVREVLGRAGFNGGRTLPGDLLGPDFLEGFAQENGLQIREGACS